MQSFSEADESNESLKNLSERVLSLQEEVDILNEIDISYRPKSLNNLDIGIGITKKLNRIGVCKNIKKLNKNGMHSIVESEEEIIESK